MRTRLLIGSLAVAAAVSVGGGWWLAHRANGTTDDVILQNASDLNPTLGTNAKLTGAALPDVSVQALDGTTLRTSSFVGTPTVINIWFSTCGPCKAELPAFADVSKELGTTVRFVGLDPFPASAAEEEFARSRGVDYDLYYDADGTFVSAAGIAAFPQTLFVAADGRIVTQSGALDAGRLRQLVHDLLQA